MNTSFLNVFVYPGRRWVGLMLFACLLFVSNSAMAQLPQDVRDVFEGMLDSLDDELKSLFEKAIKEDTDKVEFTAEQFLRFRDNPANPFEGLDQIDIKPGEGNVALKFELPSMRNRSKSAWERQHGTMLTRLQSPTQSVAASVVRVYSGNRQVSLGAVVDADGLIVTKASEVELRDELTCRFGNGQSYQAKRVLQDEANDLAILRIEAAELPTIRWSDAKINLGDFLLTPDSDGSVIKLGTVSVQPRSTQTGERAFLGVQPMDGKLGVAVFDVRPGSASYDAGLRDADEIIELDQQPIKKISDLVKAIRNRRPGDQVEILYQRKGVQQSVVATLGGNQISGERAARFKMMNRLGAVPSRRSDNFASVFQHDSPLFPENCGGPIVNLDGEVVGLNIARKGRAASYALPSSVVKQALQRLLQDRIANAAMD